MISIESKFFIAIRWKSLDLMLCRTLLLCSQYWYLLTSQFTLNVEPSSDLYLSLVKYGQFILLVRQICRTAGRDRGLKTTYAVEISLISVAIVGIGFISEAILCVEYIQGTRLALIKANPTISAVFAVFSIMKCEFQCLKNWNKTLMVFFSVFTMGEMAFLASTMERSPTCLHT